MTTDRIAAFGKRAFFAGAAFALVLSTVWRAFDWPEWLGAFAAFAGGFGAYRLIEWAAARWAARTATPDPEHTGRCGHRLDSWSRSAPLVCALPAGHAGWHRDENRAEWSPDEITWKATS